MTDHDQRFKTLLREFLPEFFELFFPEFGPLLDFARVEWLDKELFPDPPEGRRREADLVAKLPLLQEIELPPDVQSDAMLALIHVEIESGESVVPISARMPWYFLNLLRSHRLPVLPVVVFLSVGHEGIGERVYEARFGPLSALTFRFLSVGLPALDGVEYLERGNNLVVALSALMRIPADRRPLHKAEALRRLAQASENELRRFYLAECVETYLPLAAEEQEEFQNLIDSDQFTEAKEMATTYFEKGVEKGREKGFEEGLEKGREEGLEKGREQGREVGELAGRRAMLSAVLQARFGELAPDVQQRIKALTGDELQELGKRAVHAASLADLGLES
jgi:hypothetical protein